MESRDPSARSSVLQEEPSYWLIRLKAEVYSSPESYAYETVAPRIGDIDDYDEVFEDDDD